MKSTWLRARSLCLGLPSVLLWRGLYCSEGRYFIVSSCLASDSVSTGLNFQQENTGNLHPPATTLKFVSPFFHKLSLAGALHLNVWTLAVTDARCYVSLRDSAMFPPRASCGGRLDTSVDFVLSRGDLLSTSGSDLCWLSYFNLVQNLDRHTVYIFACK
jgi:hypothetical protein